MKKIFLAFSLLGITIGAFGQLSQRTNDSGQFKSGTRPVAGDMGINIQLYSPFSGISPASSYFEEIPIVNVQYYLEDDLALRLGVRASKEKTVFVGENAIDTISTSVSANNVKDSEGEYMIYLGAEKHFALTNLLDVYYGAQLPVGYQFDTNVNDLDYNNGDYSHTTTKNQGMIYGLECFLGLQVFIADLPIAIGAEWGIAGYGRIGAKSHTISEIKTGATTTTQDYYVATDDTSSRQYESMKASKFEMNNMLRLRISYYFNQ